MHAWLQQGELKPGCILIPSCARGHEAIELARPGFAVPTIDIAPSSSSHLERELATAYVNVEVICGE